MVKVMQASSPPTAKLAVKSHRATRSNSPVNQRTARRGRPLSHCPGPAKLSEPSQQAIAVQSRSRLDAWSQASSLAWRSVGESFLKCFCGADSFAESLLDVGAVSWLAFPDGRINARHPLRNASWPRPSGGDVWMFLSFDRQQSGRTQDYAIVFCSLPAGEEAACAMALELESVKSLTLIDGFQDHGALVSEYSGVKLKSVFGQ